MKSFSIQGESKSSSSGGHSNDFHLFNQAPIGLKSSSKLIDEMRAMVRGNSKSKSNSNSNSKSKGNSSAYKNPKNKKKENAALFRDENVQQLEEKKVNLGRGQSRRELVPKQQE